MHINFTTKAIFSLIFLLGFFFLGCFEEPTMEPVKRPYSSVRVGNFSYNRPGFSGNLDQLALFIDGESKGTIGINQLTGYFDLASGKRRFVLLSGVDTVYKGDIAINSYEEMSVIFDGVYAPAIDTLMSFAPYSLSDGYVYTPDAPKAGNVFIFTTNVAPNTDSVNQLKYSLSFVSTAINPNTGKSLVDTTQRNLYDYNNTYGIELPGGEYKVAVMEDKSEALAVTPNFDTLATFMASFGTGLRENIFLTGEPNKPVAVKDSQTPLPVRPK